MDWQNSLAVLIVCAAALWAVKMLASPVLAALRARDDKGCSGGCGCENTACKPEAKSPHDAT